MIRLTADPEPIAPPADTSLAARQTAARVQMFCYSAEHPGMSLHEKGWWVVERMRAMYDEDPSVSDTVRLRRAEEEWTEVREAR